MKEISLIEPPSLRKEEAFTYQNILFLLMENQLSFYSLKVFSVF